MVKRCIFHIPCVIDKKRKSASNLRPFNMIEAFKRIGYSVDVVMGDCKTRKQQIAQIKKNINDGYKYDFLYSESSTMPTMLTDKSHLPLYPMLDFNFFKYCKKNNIKIGLFYRDIHWKFDLYKRTTSFFKRNIAIIFYKIDLFFYKKYVDLLFIPSNRVGKFLSNISIKKEVLPSGSIYDEKLIRKIDYTREKELRIFYVGGLSDDIYSFEKLFKVVSKKKNVHLVVCCREKEWEINKNKYEKYCGDNIKIVHETGAALEKYYNESNLVSLFFKQQEYMSIAMPYKLFEYISHGIPIIATKNTAAGDFVSLNKIGWAINYNEKELSDLFDYILLNGNDVNNMCKNIKNISKSNTWECRARKVANYLFNKK